MNTGRLNFSWLIPEEVAGHGAPSSDDDLIYLKGNGIKALVRMAEAKKVRVTKAQIEKLGFSDCHEPVIDFSAPKQSEIDKMVAFIEACVAKKCPVGVSCTAGIGRTGTILACYLAKKGRSADEAMDEVKIKRGAEIEMPDQKAAVREYANRLCKH